MRSRTICSMRSALVCGRPGTSVRYAGCASSRILCADILRSGEDRDGEDSFLSTGFRRGKGPDITLGLMERPTSCEPRMAAFVALDRRVAAFLDACEQFEGANSGWLIGYLREGTEFRVCRALCLCVLVLGRATRVLLTGGLRRHSRSSALLLEEPDLVEIESLIPAGLHVIGCFSCLGLRHRPWTDRPPSSRAPHPHPPHPRRGRSRHRGHVCSAVGAAQVHSGRDGAYGGAGHRRGVAAGRGARFGLERASASRHGLRALDGATFLPPTLPCAVGTERAGVRGDRLLL